MERENICNAVSLLITVLVLCFGPCFSHCALVAEDIKDQLSKNQASRSLHDVLVSRIAVSIKSTDFRTAASMIETIVRERFANVPKNFRIRFDGKALELIAVTQSGRLEDFHLENQTVAEVLTALVVAQDYNRGLKDLTDKRQRVVWTIAPVPRTPKEPEVILITDRITAMRLKYPVPRVFLAMQNNMLKIVGTPLGKQSADRKESGRR